MSCNHWRICSLRTKTITNVRDSSPPRAAPAPAALAWVGERRQCGLELRDGASSAWRDARRPKATERHARGPRLRTVRTVPVESRSRATKSSYVTSRSVLRNTSGKGRLRASHFPFGVLLSSSRRGHRRSAERGHGDRQGPPRSFTICFLSRAGSRARVCLARVRRGTRPLGDLRADLERTFWEMPPSRCTRRHRNARPRN
jgi:hypothetical protein